MASGTVKNNLTRKAYSVTLSTNQYVSPYTTFGSTVEPINDISTYGNIVGMYCEVTGGVCSYDRTNNRIAIVAGITGTYTLYVIFSKEI